MRDAWRSRGPTARRQKRSLSDFGSQYPDGMVEVGVSELRRSRDRLAGQAQAAEQAGEIPTSGLLLFYAAECGLKAELLRSVLNRNDTAGLPSDLRSHDLRRLAKALNLQNPGPGPDPLRCRRHRVVPGSSAENCTKRGVMVQSCVRMIRKRRWKH